MNIGLIGYGCVGYGMAGYAAVQGGSFSPTPPAGSMIIWHLLARRRQCR
jgi:hypothetical protein